MPAWKNKIAERLLSPIQVEIFLDQKEKQLIQFLAAKFNILIILILAFAIGGALISNVDAFSTDQSYRMNGGYGIVRLIRYVVGWLVLLSPLTLMFHDEHRKVGLFFITLVGWAIITWHYFGTLSSPLLLSCIFISLPLQLLMSYFFLKKCPAGNYKKKPILMYTALFFLLEGAISYLILTYVSERKVFVFWNLKSQFIFFTTLAAFYFSKNRKKFADNFIVPANCLIGFIWPTSTMLCPNEIQIKVKLWTHGILNIIFGYAIIGVRIFYEVRLLDKIDSNVVKYSGYYILAILAIVGHLNILSGVARIYGLIVVDATRFIWLARSPAEYWRRGVVYHYLFIKNFILLSLYRRIKLTVICIFLGFAFFLVNKIGVVNYSLFINQFLGLGFFESEIHSTGRELFALIQWTLWFLLLLASPYLFGKTRLFENRFVSWGSILLTHSLMASTYYVSYILQSAVLQKHILW